MNLFMKQKLSQMQKTFLWLLGGKREGGINCKIGTNVCTLLYTKQITNKNLRRKVMTNLDSIFKSRDITLPTEVCLVKAMVFPVVMYGCESWTVKKAECRRIDTSELWCWRRLLRVP